MARLIFTTIASVRRLRQRRERRLRLGGSRPRGACLRQRPRARRRHVPLRAAPLRDDGLLGHRPDGRGLEVGHDYARIWQAADKVVYSRTLDAVTSDRTTLQREFDPAAVARLVAAAERDVSIGGPTLAAEALRAGIVDELADPQRPGGRRGRHGEPAGRHTTGPRAAGQPPLRRRHDLREVCRQAVTVPAPPWRHDDHRPTSTRMSGPAGRSVTYCGYLAARASSARSPSGSVAATIARVAVGAHPPQLRPVVVVVVDEQAHAGFGRDVGEPLRARVDFGLASTALHTTSPSTTKTIGTRCGRPSRVDRRQPRHARRGEALAPRRPRDRA